MPSFLMWHLVLWWFHQYRVSPGSVPVSGCLSGDLTFPGDPNTSAAEPHGHSRRPFAWSVIGSLTCVRGRREVWPPGALLPVAGRARPHVLGEALALLRGGWGVAKEMSVF